MHAGHTISACTENLCVPGERWQGAGDIDHACGLCAKDRIQHSRIAALAGRIDDHDIRPQPLPDERRKDFFGGAGEKNGIFNPVSQGVGACIFNGLRHDFNAHHTRGMACQKQRDGARAAIGIHNGLVSLQLREFKGKAVKPLCLRGIDLEKREGGNGKAQAAEGFFKLRTAEEHPDLRTQNDVGSQGIDGEAYAFKPRHGGAQPCDERIPGGISARVTTSDTIRAPPVVERVTTWRTRPRPVGSS